MKNKEHIDSFDEIVFEKRNKEYGAYFLRHIYKKHMTFAVLVSSIGLLLFMSVPLVKAYYDQGKEKEQYIETTTIAELAKIKKDKEENIPPPPPPPPPDVVEQKAAFKAPIVTSDTTEATADLPDQDALSKQGGAPPPPPPTDIVIEEAPKEAVKVIQTFDDPVEYVSVEEMPEFPGGEAALQMHIRDNVKYPQMAKESGIQGTVYVKFVVNEQGIVYKAEILRGIGGGCDEEAIRIVKSLPKWTPGKQNGKPVKVTFTVPIRFILQ